MPINDALLREFENESSNTRKMLQRVPEEKFGWQPHEKSFTLGRLATHVADTTHWITSIMSNDEFDFAKRTYKSSEVQTSEELMNLFEKNFTEAKDALQKATDEDFNKKWKLRAGEKIYFDIPKIAAIRAFALSHLIHHRGQLSVYLRLLDIPVPGMYGPTADEPM